MNVKKEFAGYSAAAGAVLLGAAGAEAAIVHTEANLTFGFGDNFIDMNDDSTMDFNFSNTVDGTSSGDNIVKGLNGAHVWNAGSPDLVINVAEDGEINSSKPFDITGFLHRTSSGDFSAGNFQNPGYIGVRFDPAGGFNWKYGWIHFDSVSGDGLSYHVDGYAYETDGGSIVAGAVPEPSSLALLALGAAGVRFLRKRYDQV